MGADLSTPNIVSCCRSCSLCRRSPAAVMLAHTSQIALTTAGATLKKKTNTPSVDTQISREKLRLRNHKGSEPMIVGSLFVSERKSLPALPAAAVVIVKADDDGPGTDPEDEFKAWLSYPFLSAATDGALLRKCDETCTDDAVPVLLSRDNRSDCARDIAPALLAMETLLVEPWLPGSAAEEERDSVSMFC